jgi:hypothetical protein
LKSTSKEGCLEKKSNKSKDWSKKFVILKEAKLLYFKKAHEINDSADFEGEYDFIF